MSKWQRTYSMTVQGRSGKVHTIAFPLTCVFDTVRRAFGTTNTGHFMVYNLDPATRLDLQYDYQYETVQRNFSFYAGYVSEGNGVPPLVCTGNLQKAFSYRDGPDVITDFTVLDGGWGIIKSQINATFTAPYDPVEAITAVVATMAQYGVTLGAVGTLFDDYEPTKDYTFTGSTWDAVKDYAAACNGYACIDFGKVYVLAQADVLVVTAPRFIPDLNATTGLINTPRRSGWNLDAEMLFEPNVQLNQKLIVNSSVEPYTNGTYAVQAIAHKGIISGAKDGGCETALTLVGYPTGFTTVTPL